MQRCFAEYHRVLKPGRWMTVVFSNSKAAVWNAIQVALQQAGFVVAEVTALDKVQGSYRQVTSTTAIKQDLVISAYKPNGGLEDRLQRRGPTPESAWDFVDTHLKQLTAIKVTSGDGAQLVKVLERDPRRIYDRLAAWFIRHDALVPISTPEFLAELAVRYAIEDGMVFLPEQLSAYQAARARIPRVAQMELFVSDERSAIDWLAEFLKRRPSTYPEVHPEFIRQLGAGWRKHEAKPELAALLEENFLQYDPNGRDGDRCRPRSMPTSPPTGPTCAISTRPTRASRPRPRTAGLCRTRTRPGTWRESASGPCSRSSTPTAPSPAAGSKSFAWRYARRLQTRLVQQGLPDHHRPRRQGARGSAARRREAADVVRPGPDPDGGTLNGADRRVSGPKLRALRDVTLGSLSSRSR